MQANELRINNIVNLYGQNVTVTAIGCKDDKYYLNTNAEKVGRYIDEFAPILLTEEWLIKFVFKKTYESEFMIKYSLISDNRFEYIFTKVKDKVCKKYALYFDGIHYTYIQYVHQLQNLIFALTGSELKKV